MMFKVLIAVFVKRAVILVVTPCRLIVIYHPFFYHAVRGVGFLHLYDGNRASVFPQNICNFQPNFIIRMMIFLKK